MFALFLGLLLTLAPSDSTDDLDRCLAEAPNRSPSPISWSANIEAMWTDAPPVPPDTVRAYLPQVRWARECLLDLDSSTTSRAYLDDVMQTFDREAAVLASLRRFSDAFATFEEGRSFLKNGPAIPSTNTGRASWVPELHQNQGYLHYLLGDLSSSIKQYLKAYKTTPKDDVSQRIEHLLNLGVLQQRMQDYRSAHRYFDRAERRLKANRSSLSDRSPLRARGYHVQADLLLEETLNTEFDRAVLKRAVELARRARSLTEPEANPDRYARVSIALSESLGYLGDFDRAYRLIEGVRDFVRANEMPGLRALARLKHGLLHVQTERWSQAGTTLRVALSQARELGNLDIQRRILRALGRLHEMQEEWTHAEHYYRKGTAVIEKYRASLTASQWSMTAFSQWRDIHRGLVRTLLAQGRNREALWALDRSRARHLQDLRIQTRVVNQLPDQQRARFDSLAQALADVRNRLAKERLSAHKRAELQNRQTALMAARQQVLQLDSPVTTRPSLAEISEVLGRQDRTLVSYFLDDPWPIYDRRPRSAAFILTGDTLRTVPLPNLSQDSVRTHLEATSPLFAAQGASSRINATHFDLRPLHTLQEAVYAPVAKHLSEGHPLTVVPSGPLFRIPFSMLVRSMPSERYAHSEARYVLHERPITLELASSLVADTTQPPRLTASAARAELAAFGVSNFDTLQTVPAALRSRLSSSTIDSTLTLPDLPGVRAELHSVRQRVKSARVFLNEAATEEALWRTSQRADALHLASHAVLHPSSPLHNAILLHPDSSGRETDGILFLHELQSRERRMRLVVLSGCNTARGTRRGGEGMQGMQYAFRATGTEATISSLWPVADEDNVEMVDAFYRYLGEDLRKDEALRRAKLEYLETHPDRASPFFWATTVLYGSPAPLDLNTSNGLPTRAWWGLLGGGAFLIGLLVWGWRRNLVSRRRP